MVKRILCKVISSVPLSKASVTLSLVNHLNNDQHGYGYIAVADMCLKQISNSSKNYKIPNITLETLDYPIGQILDCDA